MTTDKPHFVQYNGLSQHFPKPIEQDILQWCISNKEMIADKLEASKDFKTVGTLFEQQTLYTGADPTICYCAQGKILNIYGFDVTEDVEWMKKEIDGVTYLATDYQAMPEAVMPEINFNKLLTDSEKDIFIFAEDDVPMYITLADGREVITVEYLLEITADKLFSVLHADDLIPERIKAERISTMKKYLREHIHDYWSEGKMFYSAALSSLNDACLVHYKSFKEVARAIRFFW